jgi:hypothetical protein
LPEYGKNFHPQEVSIYGLKTKLHHIKFASIAVGNFSVLQALYLLQVQRGLLLASPAVLKLRKLTP